MTEAELITNLQILSDRAWDREVRWEEINAWAGNFVGAVCPLELERKYALTALSKFLYFSKRLVREMLRSLYRDQFEAPLVQSIRRDLQNTRNVADIRRRYELTLAQTRFVATGNPSESGTHLLYYFRQVNRLPKDMFIDLGTALHEIGAARQNNAPPQLNPNVLRYVFFDDLVGSAQQVRSYLLSPLGAMRAANSNLELRFMSLFSTTGGLQILNEPQLFGGNARCLFELDDTFRVFHASQRYFPATMSAAFDLASFEAMASHYGGLLFNGHPLGYRDGQLLLGFTHNTPDNTLPIFWSEGRARPWSPIFVRYEKAYS